MTEDALLALIARITPAEPVPVDALLADPGDSPRPPAPPLAGDAPALTPAGDAPVLTPAGDAPALTPAGDAPVGPAAPAAVLWAPPEGARPAIGIRVTRPVARPAPLALRIASAALERGLMPVILTTLDRCGLERFGFRVERLHGADAAETALQEAELSRFWSLAIVVDADDFAQMR